MLRTTIETYMYARANPASAIEQSVMREDVCACMQKEAD